MSKKLVFNSVQQTIPNKFLPMKLWAGRYKVNGFPKKLDSLEVENPSLEQVQKDLKTLYLFKNHPTYNYFFYGNLPQNSRKE